MSKEIPIQEKSSAKPEKESFLSRRHKKAYDTIAKRQKGIKFRRTALMILVALVLIAIALYMYYGGDTSKILSVFGSIFGAATAEKPAYELTQVDVFGMTDFKQGKITWNQISVLGIKIGDEKDKVIRVIGKPDIRNEFEGVENLEYNKKIGLNRSGLVFNIQDGVVKRITVKEPFSKYLINNTKIDKSLKQVYDTFGIPLKQEEKVYFRIFFYEEKGLDVFVYRNRMNGFSFYDPAVTVFNGGFNVSWS